jgi:hypothetical protein
MVTQAMLSFTIFRKLNTKLLALQTRHFLIQQLNSKPALLVPAFYIAILCAGIVFIICPA